MKKMVVSLLVFILFSCSDEKKAEYLLIHFISAHTPELEQLHKENANAIWESFSVNNKPDAYYHKSDSIHDSFNRRAESHLNAHSFFNNINEFEFLSRLRSSDLVKDNTLNRQLEKLYNQYAWARLDFNSMNQKQAILAKRFNELTKSKPQKEDIQYLGTDSLLTYDLRRNELIEDFKATVNGKNKAAMQAGFKNFWHYWLHQNEITNTEQEKLISSIEKITRPDYLRFKHYIDSIIITQKQINVSDISYSDFYLYYFKYAYNARIKNEVGFDSLEYRLENHFNARGFEASGIYKNSDLWYSSDKSKGSYVINMDGRNDVRIFGNFKPTPYDLINLLHETGHALYLRSVSDDIPFILSEPNMVLNEAMGFVFQSLLFKDSELARVLHLPEYTASDHCTGIELPSMLFLTRDLLVRAELEKEILRNPDQDINTLFWALKKKYFFYDQPKNEKVSLWIQDHHIINNSGIYQAYLYAAAISGQLLEHMKGKNRYGEWLTEDIFYYGDSRCWRDVVKTSTGQAFTPDYITNLYK